MEQLELEAPREIPLGLGHHGQILLPLMGLSMGRYHQSHFHHQRRKAVDWGAQVEAYQNAEGRADYSQHLISQSLWLVGAYLCAAALT